MCVSACAVEHDIVVLAPIAETGECHLLAHRDISLSCRILSQSGHCGHRIKTHRSSSIYESTRLSWRADPIHREKNRVADKGLDLGPAQLPPDDQGGGDRLDPRPDIVAIEQLLNGTGAAGEQVLRNQVITPLGCQRARNVGYVRRRNGFAKPQALYGIPDFGDGRDQGSTPAMLIKQRRRGASRKKQTSCQKLVRPRGGSIRMQRTRRPK